MANKARSNRQKLTIRIEASQKALKPRNPVALAAKQRVAGSHKASIASQRQQEQRQLQKRLLADDEFSFKGKSESKFNARTELKSEPELNDE